MNFYYLLERLLELLVQFRDLGAKIFLLIGSDLYLGLLNLDNCNEIAFKLKI